MIELLELSEVLKAVERTGTEVRYHDPDCATSKAAGWYQLNATVDRLVICPRNNINHSDLLDTVRHEAMHVVQACHGGPVQGNVIVDYVLAPDVERAAWQQALELSSQRNCTLKDVRMIDEW